MQTTLPPVALQLHHLDSLQEENVALKLASALNVEDEVVPNTAQLDLALELLVTQALTADSIVESILDNSLLLTSVALISATAARGLLGSDRLETNDTLGEALGKLLRVLTDDGTLNLNIRKETVRGGRNGREFGVVGTDTLDTMHFHLDLLTGPHLGDQNVGVHGADGPVINEKLLLTTDGVEGDVFSIDMGMVVQLARVLLIVIGVGVLGALDVEVQNNGVIITGAFGAGALLIIRWLAEPVHPVDALHRALEGDQTQALSHYLILDDGGVIVNEDVFNGESRDLSHENTAESVGDGGIEANQRERGFVRVIAVVLDFEVLFAHRENGAHIGNLFAL